MTVYNRFIFSRTLVYSNIFCLRLIRAFFHAWFAQNKFLTELFLAISGVHSSFATIFQYLKFGRFCLYSKLKLSYRFSLQRCKPFLDIFFHLREISKQTLGNIKKTGLILSSESVNMLIRGVVTAVRVVKIHSKSTPIVFLLYLKHFVFIPLSLLCASKVATELWNHNFTIFRTVINFVLIFRQLSIFRMRWKSPKLFALECCFHWWKPFSSIYNSLRENGRQSWGSN